MAVVGALMLILLVGLGLSVMLFGSFSRWIVRSILVLLVLSVVVGSVHLDLLLSHGGAILLIALVLATKSFWRVLLFCLRLLAARHERAAKEAYDAKRSKRIAVEPSGPRELEAGDGTEAVADSSTNAWVK